MLFPVLLLAAAAASPSMVEAGRYCARQPVVGHTGEGTVPLGRLRIIVDVQRTGRRNFVAFTSQLPDSQEVLTGGPAVAGTMADGSLRFRFTDGWDNQGEGRLSPDGRFVLEVRRPSPQGGTNITRNYGTFQVSRDTCRPENLPD